MDHNPIVENKRSWLFDRLNRRITDNDDTIKQNWSHRFRSKIERLTLTEQNVTLLVTQLITHFSWNGQSFQMP